MATEYLQGNYFGPAPFVVSPLEGIQKFADASKFKVLYTMGSPMTDPDTSGFEEAAKFAGEADVTTLFLGLNNEFEGSDRLDLVLPDIQLKLLHVVSRATQAAGKKLVVVAFHGGPVDYREVLPLVDGLVWAGFPGQSAGDAIAQVIFGEFNPSGRTPYATYPKEFADMMTPLDYELRTKLGFTYRFFTGTPVFPYGFGLSYTTFDVNLEGVPAQVSITDLENGAEISASVTIENTGSRSGTDIVLLFRSGGPDDAPLQELVAFDRAEDLEPGKTEKIAFTLDRRAFLLVNKDGKRVLVPGQYELTVEGSSASVELVP